MKTRIKRSIVWKMSNEEFTNLVKNSKSVGDICTKLSHRKGGSIFSNIKNRIEKMKLDTSHFVDCRKGSYSPVHLSKDAFMIRLKNETITDYSFLKKKLLEFSILENRCQICGIYPNWNKKPLTLHMDHIDGNSKNNTLQNLRMLCPNCHTQTETYSMGQRKRRESMCIDCKCITSGYGNRCQKCASIFREIQKRMVGDTGIEPVNQECRSCSLPLA